MVYLLKTPQSVAFSAQLVNGRADGNSFIVKAPLIVHSSTQKKVVQ